MSDMQIKAAKHFRVVMRTWENGRLCDEQTILPEASFEEASSVSRKLTGERVRLNNQDVTVSVEPVSNRARS